MPTRRKQTYAECVAERRCPCCHLLHGPDEKFKLCEHCRILHKKRLIARMAKGGCRHCKARATHRDLCEKHHEQGKLANKKRMEFRRANGLCQECGASASKARCEKCAALRSEATKRRRKKLRRAGLCTSCEEPAVPDRSLCPKCAEKSVKKERLRHLDPARRADQRARSAARKVAYTAAGLCNACGKRPPREDRKVCKRCGDRSREGACIAATKERAQRLLAQNKKNPAHTARDPAGFRKFRKV